ncbi:hypothetical protein TNCV_3825171 [Trichonephila clavipes]|nr:hypothetical protein TNCV_3825171 [Trichonephila clavipes]
MSPLQTQPSIVSREEDPVYQASWHAIHGAADVDELAKPTLVHIRSLPNQILHHGQRLWNEEELARRINYE